MDHAQEKRIFLHIGAPKTGTTYLQTLMWENQRELRRQNLLLPGRRRWDSFLAYQYIRRIDAQSPKTGAAWERLRADIEGWPGNALISHEFLCAADEKQAAWTIEQLAPAYVHVIYTARDYLRQGPSVWQEGLKMSGADSFDKFVEAILRNEQTGVWSWLTQDGPSILKRWGANIPPEHVHVITVPQSGAPPDLLLRRWCGLLDIDPEALNHSAARRNQLLGAPQAVLLRRLKAELHPRSRKSGAFMHRWFRAYLAEDVLASQAGERFGIPRQYVDDFVRMSEATVESFQQAGYDIVGDLSELLPDVDAMPTAMLGDVSDSDMLDAAVAAIDRMLDDIREVTENRDKWRKRAQAAGKPTNDKHSILRLPNTGRHVADRLLGQRSRLKAYLRSGRPG